MFLLYLLAFEQITSNDSREPIFFTPLKNPDNGSVSRG